MKLTTILFDLDGTLLPMDQDAFTKGYFKLLAQTLAPHGYEMRELMQVIWQGVEAMIRNPGPETNEDAFWRLFCAHYGENARKDEPYFDAFYRNEFQQARAFCSPNPKAAEAVRVLRNMGLILALATHPVFPAVATESRIHWAGLDKNDFSLCTTYENTVSAKPNPAYYRQILETLHVQPQECLMVGNDVTEDGAALKAGIPVFLLTDCLINRENADISAFPQGSFDDLLNYIKELRG